MKGFGRRRAHQGFLIPQRILQGRDSPWVTDAPKGCGDVSPNKPVLIFQRVQKKGYGCAVANLAEPLGCCRSHGRMWIF